MVYILPYAKKHLADEALSFIRSHQRHELNYVMECQIRELRKEAALVGAPQIGKSYGTFGFSPFANAWREGELLKNHGEVYIYLHTFLMDKKLHSRTAWGGDSIAELRNDMLLIEC